MANKTDAEARDVVSTGRSTLPQDAGAPKRNAGGTQVTIVMYHYVRPLARTRFPEIKGLDLEDFRSQIRYIDRHYHVISTSELIAAIDGEMDLPENAALLTFDDGYADHYTYAMPILDAYGMSGIFFPPVDAVRKRRVLDVNKVHFVLASGVNIHDLIAQIHTRLRDYRGTYDLPDEKTLFEQYATASRFDTKEVIYVKRLLQKGLPTKVRGDIVDSLFSEIVTEDEKSFAEELYMTEDQLRSAVRNGFDVGAHGVAHVWLDAIPREQQVSELRTSRSFVQALGMSQDQLSIAYPYGGVNTDVCQLARTHGFKIGFTVKPMVSDLDGDDLLLLPRLDTNDLKSALSELN